LQLLNLSLECEYFPALFYVHGLALQLQLRLSLLQLLNLLLQRLRFDLLLGRLATK